VPGYDPGSSANGHLGLSAKVGPSGALFFDEDCSLAAFDPWSGEQVYHGEGIPGPHDFPPTLKQDWQQKMGVSPRQFFQTLFDTPRVHPGDFRLTVERDKVGVQGLGVEIDLRCPRTNKEIGKMDRQFSFPEDSPPEAYHRLFDLEPGTQGTGIAKDLLANSIKLYDQAGIGRVGVFASLGVGGYAWAKYGFAPKPGRQTRELFATIEDRLNRMDDLPKSTKGVVKRLLSSGDPKAIWAISDLDGVKVKRKGKMQPLGKALLLGTAWRGSLNLDDPKARARFDQYVHKTSQASEGAK
jgi:hypothetical protein